MTAFKTKLITPTLTFTLLEEKHMAPVVRNLLSGKFQLYMLGHVTSLELNELTPVEGNPNLLVLQPKLEAHGSAAVEVSEGDLLISNDAGEVAVLNLMWIFGERGETGFNSYAALTPAQKKRYIPHQLLLNALPS